MSAVAVAAYAIRDVARNPNPPTPPFQEDAEWITAYLGIHMLSVPSRRYAYLLWFAFALLFLAYSIAHLCGAHGGYLGARWSRFGMRRWTWKTGRKEQRRTIFTFPSHARILSRVALLIVVAAACTVGPDYISPTSGIFDFSPSKRHVSQTWDPSMFVGYAPAYTIEKSWWTAGGRTGMIAFALLPLCVVFALKAPPFAIFSIPHIIHLSFDKLAYLHRWTAWIIWTLSAVHAALWSVQLSHDKRPNVFADSHLVEHTAYTYAWSYYRFLCAWGALGLFTLLMLTSLSPLRQHHYETFYFLHVLLVPMTIVMAALHHPPIAYWCWASLAIWVAERLWRTARWTWMNRVLFQPVEPTPSHNTRWSDQTLIPPHGQVPMNGIVPFTLKESTSFPLPSAAASPIQSPTIHSPKSNVYPPTPFSPASPSVEHKRWSNASSVEQPHTPTLTSAMSTGSTFNYTPPPGFAHAELMAGYTIRLVMTPARRTIWAPGQHFLLMIPHVSRILTHPFTIATCYDAMTPGQEGAIVFVIRAKAGWTRDLWNMVAACSHRGMHVPPGEGLPTGWTPPQKGVVLRALVDGPFGSSGRVRWGEYGTAVIFAGGSGVSFGLSILEHLCLHMAGRDAKSLGRRGGQWRMQRVHFVWLVREYSHLQWCSSILRRCLGSIPAPVLQVNIFVTNATPETVPRPRSLPIQSQQGEQHHEPHNIEPQSATTPTPLIEVLSPTSPTLGDVRLVSTFPPFAQDSPAAGPHSSAILTPINEDIGHLAPPMPGFVRAGSPRGSLESTRTESSGYSAFDLSYYRRAGRHSGLSNLAASAVGDIESMRAAEDEEIDHDMDLTNWDGDDDKALPGESRLSKQVAKAGTKRRMASIRRSMGAHGHGSWMPSEHRASALSHDSRPASSTPPVSHSLAGPVAGRTTGHDRLVHGPSPLITSLSSSGANGQPSRISLLMPSPISEDTHEYSNDDTATITSRPGTPNSSWDARASIHSASGLFADAARAIGHRRTASERVRLEVEQRELRELAHVAEFAHPGRPNVRAILRDEVEHASGPVVVAVCGPMTLNTVVRKAVAALIDPSRIWKGDERGWIELVSEEFEY